MFLLVEMEKRKMERREVLLVAGIIMALIWLGIYMILKGKKRKYVIIAGCIIDLVLFLICKNGVMLFFGIIGGLLGGLLPGLGGSLSKYYTVVKELKGVANLVIAMIIFCSMIMMVIASTYSELFGRGIVWKLTP